MQSRSTPAQAQVVVGAREHLIDDAGGNEAREDVAHTLALDRLAHVQDGERSKRSQREREQRVDEGDDPAAVERELRGDRERDRQQQCRQQRARGS